MANHAFLRHAAIYGLASLLLQAAGFVLLPLFTRCLGPGEFGSLELLGRTADVLLTCLLLSGVRQGLVALHEQADSENERRQIAGAAFLVMAVACAGAGAAIYWWAEPLTDLLQVERSALLLLATGAALLEVFWLVPLTLIQVRMQSGRYLLITLSQFVVRVAVSVVLVAWWGLGVAGVLGAMALTSGCYALALCVGELSVGVAWPSLRHLRALLAFALPFLPGSLCFFAIHYGDRYFLLHWHGREEVGFYALGYKLALGVGTLSLNPMQMVWGVQMYREAKSPEAPVVFGRAFTRILAAYVYVGLGLALLAPDVVQFLGGAAYARSAAVVAPVVLAGLFQSAAALMDASFYVRRRTELKLVLTGAATLATLSLYALLIPAGGSLGAAWATVGGFGLLAAVTWPLAQRVFPVRYEWTRVASVTGLAVGLWALAQALPPGGASLPGRVALAVFWPILLGPLGLVSKQEKQYLGDLLGEWWKRVGPGRGRGAASALDAPPAPQAELAQSR